MPKKPTGRSEATDLRRFRVGAGWSMQAASSIVGVARQRLQLAEKVHGEELALRGFELLALAGLYGVRVLDLVPAFASRPPAPTVRPGLRRYRPARGSRAASPTVTRGERAPDQGGKFRS